MNIKIYYIYFISNINKYMGVPHFFAWLIQHNYLKKQLLCSNIDKQAKCLYLDSNCLFHPQCFKVLDFLPNEINIDNLESQMIKRIIKYINFIITEVNPTDFVFISVDGVAPIAKIGQQRKRRYKSVDDDLQKNILKQKYNIPHNENWSNIVITPGTDFMNKLDLSIQNYCNSIKHINVIYSSYHVPGEGEHKILQHLKSLNITNDPIIIYGLDADLIFLSMASKQNNISLLRESSQIDSNKHDDSDLNIIDINDVYEKLVYVPIDLLKSIYNNRIKSLIKNKNNSINIDNINFINDFIVLCFFLGNDFLPHFPSINIKCDGIETILDAYTTIYISNNQTIINNINNVITFNNKQLGRVLKLLGDNEKYYFNNILPKFLIDNNKKKCHLLDNYSKELWNLEHLKNIDIIDNIKLGYGDTTNWKFRYYEHYFGSIEHQHDLINSVCMNYLEGFVWVSKYYFEHCKSWRWQYKYLHAPFISDLADYIIKFDIDLNAILFNINSPIKISNQLLALIPPIHSHLLPPSLSYFLISNDSPIIYMFPVKVTLDMLYKNQLWQCIPLVPYLDIDAIEDCTNNLIFDKLTVNKFLLL